MPADIITAISDYLDASAAVTTAIPGGMWAGEIPAGAEMPYGRIVEVSDVAQLTTEDDYYAEKVVQFSVFAATRGEAYDGARAIFKALAPYRGYAVLEFDDGYEMTRFPKTEIRTTAEAEDAPGGGTVWHAHFDCEWLIGRTHGV